MIIVGSDKRRDILSRHATTDQPGDARRHPV
jgi:hypothetical protein